MTQETSMQAQSDARVIVVGGGMVGISTAIWLQREGQVVTLIDKGTPEDRASYGNAGMLASASVLPVTMPGLLGKIPKLVLKRSEPLYLRWSYLPRMMPWAMRYLSHANAADVRRIAGALEPIIGNSLEDHLALTQGTEARRFIRPCDFAVLYKDAQAFKGDALGWQIRKDLGFDWSEHRGADRSSYDPIFSDDLSYLAALSNHGQITDPGAYLAALRDHFEQQGGQILTQEVQDITQSDGRATGVVIPSGQISAAAVVITAGAWSPLLTKKLGVNIPVEAESGYHLEFWDPSITPRMPTLVPSVKLLFSPMEGRLRAAGAVEFGGLSNTGRKMVFDMLRKAVKQVLPDLTYSRETQWMGHRPAPTDSVPIIDQLPDVKGVFLGFGHQHVGLTGSARTGQILAQMVSGKTPNIDLSPYSVGRFTSGPASKHKETA